MGVSFKLSKVGTRFRSKPVALQQPENGPADDSNEPSWVATEGKADAQRKQTADDSIVSAEANSISLDEEVSIVLNLYTDGYSTGKPLENENPQDTTKSLRPYNRTSQNLFSAIACGQIPADILDGMPCKYSNGSIICEVRDYRKSTSQLAPSAPTNDSSPIITKARLKISLENVVRDIPPLISDNSWTYGDLMEVESRILKALQPQLCLDPTPKLNKLCNEPIPSELKMALSSARKKRLRQLPEVTVTSSNRMLGKKVRIDCLESSDGRLGEPGMVPPNVSQPNVQENLIAQSFGLPNTFNASPRGLMSDPSFPNIPLVAQQQRYPMMVGNSRAMMDRVTSPAAQEMMISYSDNNHASPSLHGRRENQEGPMSPLSGSSKRTRPTPSVPDAIQQQHLGQQMDNLHGSDMNWKNSLLQQQVLARGMQYPNAALQKYPSQQYSDGMLKAEPGIGQLSSGLQGMRYGSMEEQLDAQKLVGSETVQVNKQDMSGMEMDKDRLDLQQQNQQHQQRMHPNALRSGFSQGQWNNMNQHFENNLKKEEQLQKRKSVQSPRVSAGARAQSPMSSKSGEFSSGSLGPAFGAIPPSQMTALPHKEKSLGASVPAVGPAGSITSSANDSAPRQNMHQAGGRRRSTSLPKPQAISGVGSPASVSNINVPLNASSPSISTPPMADQSVLERFSKIEMVNVRYQLNRKKTKGDNYPVRNPGPFPAENLTLGLSNIFSSEDFQDDSCTRRLSKLLLGGSMNTCKTRLLNCMQGEHVVQGNNVVSFQKIRGRMILSEKPSNGTVAFAYGDIEEGDILEAEDYLPTLPNTHFADLLAEQFKSLVTKEGYNVEDHIQPRPTRLNNHAASGQLSNPGIPLSNSMGQIPQFSEGVPGQSSNEMLNAASGVNSPLNQAQIANTRIIPPGNQQALQMSQGLLPGVSMAARPQQMDPQQRPQQPQQQQQPMLQNQNPMIQQHHTQLSRSPMMLGSNSISQLNPMGQNTNIPMGDLMNKASSLQLQMLQQPQQQQSQLQPAALQQNQQQQQTPSQMQRKMMGMGMGNMGGNLVGLAGLGGAIGIGGPRGIAGAGISAGMGAMTNLGNVGQNPVNLSQSSSITDAISKRIQSGGFSAAQAAMVTQKFRAMQQNRNMLGGPQAGMGGMPGGRQMALGSAGLSMLGPGMNRPNMGAMQRPGLGPMGPPKMMPGMNMYMNPQQMQMQQPMQQQSQMQLHQQQQQQMQLQQQQMQQLQQQQAPQKLNQQDTNSPLQSVMSPPPPQIGSPPPNPIGMPQMSPQQIQQQPTQQPQQPQQQLPPQQPQQQLQPQQPQQQQQQSSPQQMSQRTPMSPQQISSGGIHPMSAGNQVPCPPSPQLSNQSQNLGSVGSMSNSPMDVQNKSNSMGNP